MKAEASSPIRLLVVDLMRGLAVTVMFFPHVIYQIYSFHDYKGVKHFTQVGLSFLAKGGDSFAGILFFSVVGLSFYISVSNKPSQSFFKQKMLTGISLLLIQEIISIGFFNGDMGLGGQYVNNAQLFENSFHILNFIGWATIILTFLFSIGVLKSNTYLLAALILMLLQPFNYLFSEKFIHMMMLIAPAPVVNYLANALFTSGCSIFTNLPTIFFGIYIGDLILRHYNHRTIENPKTLSISTILMIAYSLIIGLWVIRLYDDIYMLWFVTQFYRYFLIYFIYIIIDNFSIAERYASHKEYRGNLFGSSQNIFDRIINYIQGLKIDNIFILLGIYSLPVYVYHWDIISKVLKPISQHTILSSSPVTTCIYLFGFIMAWFVILQTYHSKLRDSSIFKLFYFYFYQYRWIGFCFGTTFAILSFATKLYLAYGIGPHILIYNYNFYYFFKYISLAFLIYFLRTPKAILIKAK